MTPLTLLIAILPVLPLISAAPNHGPVRVNGKPSGAATGPQKCVTVSNAGFYGQTNTNDTFLGMYGQGVVVQLLCFTTGAAYGGNFYWDQTSDGHFIPEKHFSTTCAYNLPACN